MAYEPKDGSGSLFKNDRKESDNHPDYKGQLMVGGVQYWLSAWIKETDEGKKWMSIATTPKDAQKPAQQARRTSRNDGDVDDDLPF